jgi:alpha-N-arabinofuranosidase
MIDYVRMALVIVGLGIRAQVALGPDAGLRDTSAVASGPLAIASEQGDPAQFPVVVTREPLQAGRISPYQYGQFIEYLCNVVPSMWADKLWDGSFEGLSPYKVAYLKETDFRERPWYPAGATNRANFERDAQTKVSGETSYRIVAGDGARSTVAVAQDGISVDQGVACIFTCSLKAGGIKGPVRVRLHREGQTYASVELAPTGEWQKYHARLVPSQTDHHVTIAIEFAGPGTLWLDNASLIPETAQGGWRSDVVAAVKAMRPGIIRFGGSTLDDPNLGDFEWRDTIGDTDKRRPFRAWGGLQPVGAGLEEFVQFCRLVDAEPLICVRFTRRRPKDAADQVEYFNGSAQTPMGALRARNGHPEPYHVRFWQVGNEQRGPEYERGLAAFCRAMKDVDPAIEVLSSYPTPGVLGGAGSLIDYVSPHHYDCADLGGVESDLSGIGALIARYVPGRPIKVAVTEWNTTAGDWGPKRARLWTLENALACSRYHNLIQRHCDMVTIACRSNLINSFCSGCIQTDNHRLYKTPTYYAQQLFATLAGDRPLRINSTLTPQTAPDLSATLSPHGDSVTLFAINDTLSPVSRPIDLSAFAASATTPMKPIEVWTLADTKNEGEPDVTNSFGEPERIIPRRTTITPAAPKFDYAFPPLSLSVLKWEVSEK